MRGLSIAVAAGLLILAALHAVAGAVGGFGTVQVVRMLEAQDSPRGAWTHAAYAVLLALAAAAGFALFVRPRSFVRALGALGGTLVAVFTLAAVARASGASASFYEFCLGEHITIGLAVLLVVVALGTPAPPARARAI